MSSGRLECRWAGRGRVCCEGGGEGDGIVEARGDSGVRTAGAGVRDGRAAGAIRTPLADGRPKSEPAVGARAARRPPPAARSTPMPRRPRRAGLKSARARPIARPEMALHS